MTKTVIIINGRGGVGKDTLCGFAAGRFAVRNVSSITPIKEIAAAHGWQGEKTDSARRFLWLLKTAFTEYCDLPTRYLMEQYRLFAAGDEEILFAHIREGNQIAHFKTEVEKEGGRCVTLLVRRGVAAAYGNAADDDVEKFPYDFVYENNLPLDRAKDDFCEFLAKNLL